MTSIEHEPLPAGSVRRLTAHYGPSIATWLQSAPKLVVEISARYGLRFHGFHDAGWTSVVATATTDLDEQPVIIKAVPEARRFAREAAALTHWCGIGACRLLHADRTDQVLLLSTVEQVGGACRPPDHQTRVGAVLPSLHARRLTAHPDVPDLARSYKERISPRIAASPHLHKVCGSEVVQALIRMGFKALDQAGPAVMLHADLYRENVLFDAGGAPVCIDPRGRRGPAEFDWAFWTVLYDRGGFTERFRIASKADAVDERALLAWVAIIAAEGLHYHVAAGDWSAAQEMLAILSSVPVEAAIWRST